MTPRQLVHSKVEISPVPTWLTTSRRRRLLGHIRTHSGVEHRATRHDSESTLGFAYESSRLHTSIYKPI
jgi:hypothetical protein